MSASERRWRGGRGRAWGRWLGLWVGAFGSACRPPPSTVPTRLVVVLVDTLRADHLGRYGYDRPTSPGLDAWSAEATVFTAAWAPSPWTLPSARALLAADRVRDFDPARTVAVRLQDAGWHTVLLSANPNLSPARGLAAGWDRAELHEDASARDQVARARDLLERRSGPTFLLLHLMDPHLPYAEPLELRHRFAGEPPSPRLADPITEPGLRSALVDTPLTPAEQRYLVDRYDQNVLAVDTALSELWPELRETDLVVVLSDHGESLGEHGRVGHGHSLGSELMHVPLMWRGPGFPPSERTERVGLDDVGATLLAAAGLPLEASLRGRDLRATPLPHRDGLMSHVHYGRAQVGLAGADTAWTTDGVRRAAADAAEGPWGPTAVPLDGPAAAAWAEAGGAPWVSVVRVTLPGMADHLPAEADGQITGVRLGVPGATGAPWWPPALLQVRPPVQRRTPTGALELTADGPLRLPAELYVPVPASRDRVDDVTVELRVDGTWSPLPHPMLALAQVPPRTVEPAGSSAGVGGPPGAVASPEVGGEGRRSP